MIDLNAVASKISNARKEKGYTQEELAVRLGVSAQAVSKWERALSLPDIELILDVSNILNMSINYLLGGNAEEDEHQHSVYDLICANPFSKDSFNPIEIRVGVELVPILSEEYLQKFHRLRQQYLNESGVLLPYITIQDDLSLSEKQCRISILGKTQYDNVFETADENAKIELFLQLKQLTDTYLYQFVNRHMTKLLVEDFKVQFPFCVDGLIPQKISLSEFKIILKTLVKEKYSIRNLYTIIETIDDNIKNFPNIGELVKLIEDALS